MVLFFVINFGHLWPLVLLFVGLGYALWKVGDLTPETRESKKKCVEFFKNMTKGEAGSIKVMFWVEEGSDTGSVGSSSRTSSGGVVGHVPIHFLVIFGFIASFLIGISQVLGVVMLWALARFIYFNKEQLQGMVDRPEERTLGNFVGLFKKVEKSKRRTL